MLYIVKNVFKILSGNVSENEIAAGFVIGLFIGLTPFGSLVNIIVFFLFFFLKINKAASCVAVALFSFIGHFTDPLAHRVGYFLLVDFEFLTPLWTQLYNMPIIPYSRFYNTVVMGNFAFSILLAVPIFILVRRFIVFYRNTVLFKKVKSIKFIKPFFGVYKIFKKFKNQ